MEGKELYELLNSFKSKTEAYKYFGLSGNSNSIRKLSQMAISVNFDLLTYNERRKPTKKYCLNCGKELSKEQKKFCSKSCSAIFNGKKRVVSDETKEKIRLKLTKISTPKEKICNICGQSKCINKEICKHEIFWFNNLSSFGFKLETIGSLLVYKEYYRIKELLFKEYHDNLLSPKDISVKYNYKYKSENILHILKTFGLKTRNRYESSINSYMSGKNSIVINNVYNKYQFKHGWHKTWDGKDIYYRSSYELKYAIELDNKKIEYEVEYFRIKYWDTYKYKYRVAIPDFYIKNENKIVEIKSRITFNKQNIIDKFNEYLRMGYTPILFFENKEYSFSEIENLNEYKFLIATMK